MATQDVQEQNRSAEPEAATPKALTSTQRIFDAVRDLREVDQIATRETVAELTGLKLSIVDDRLRALVDDGKLKRLLRGIYELGVTFPATYEQWEREQIAPDMVEVRIVRGACNALIEQAGEPRIDPQRRASIRAGLEAAGQLLAALPRKARVDAVIDLRDKLDRGDVWASDYQALLGRVEGSAA